MQPRSPYDVLGIPKNSGLKEVRAAYRQAALRTHPDKPGGNAEEFKAIHEAYEILSDSNKRESYAAESKKDISKPRDKEAATALDSFDKTIQEMLKNDRYGQFIDRSRAYRKRINEDLLPNLELSNNESLLEVEAIFLNVNALIEEALEIQKELTIEITRRGAQADSSIKGRRDNIIGEIKGFRALELPLSLLLLDKDIKDPDFLNNLATAQKKLIQQAITNSNKNEWWKIEPKILLIALAHQPSASSIENSTLRHLINESNALVRRDFQSHGGEVTKNFLDLVDKFYLLFNHRLNVHITGELTRRVNTNEVQSNALLLEHPDQKIPIDKPLNVSELAANQQTNNNDLLFSGELNLVENKNYRVTKEEGNRIKIYRKSDKLSFTYRGNIASIKDSEIYIDNCHMNLVDSEEGQAVIDKTHQRLLELTNGYLERKNPVSGSPQTFQTKKKEFNDLKIALEIPHEFTKLQRILAFEDQLLKTDKTVLEEQRSDDWKRYTYNAVSLLTLLPAFIRACNSYRKYGTIQFWQPESKKVYESLQNEKKDFDKLKRKK